DTTAAGYTWYLDPTPFDNTDDFLPTADPNIWKAKPGSEAEGKMDLLSVLLHEYGHVLGLEHSANPRNFMATTLQPGERRLPSAAELQLMSELVAQVKAEQNAPQPGLPASGGNEGLPANQRTPNQPVARRRSGTPLPQMGEGSHALYQAAINPTLLNGDFGPDGTDNWVAEGDIQVTGDTVTLNESPTMQTHLAQGFMVGEGDHTLSFTISAQNLTTNGKGPSDAFEVALLDANTGLPVVGTIDLTRTDALLNLQTDGTERLAPGVSKVINPDGSTTYTVALPDSLAGTPVLLSFDLLGFGATQSSITLRDIHLNEGNGPSYAPIARDDEATLDEDTQATGNILANDLTDGTAITHIETLSEPTHGTLTLEDDGSFTYTPEADYHGTDSFTYQLVDEQGRVSNTATVTFTINPINDAPIAPPDHSATVVAGESHTFDPLAGATDIDGDPLTVQWVTQPEHGTLTDNGDGTWTYTADADYTGADTITWRVSDGQAESANTCTLTLTVTLDAVNTAPAANDASVSLDEDSELLIDLIAWASDADGDALQTVIITQPEHGTLVQQHDGCWLYTPEPDFFGPDSFTYRVNDGQADSNIATVTLTVHPVNDAPVAADMALALDEDEELHIDLLANATDVDGDTLTAQIVTGPMHGTLTENADGSFTYTPEPDFNGNDSFTWRANDGQADSNIATVSLTVHPVNDAPVAPADRSATVIAGESVTFDPLAGASDVDGDPLTVQWVTQPEHGTLTDNGDGTWTYTADADYAGTDTLSWRVSDGQAESANTCTFTLTVTLDAVNTAPVANDASVSLDKDSSLLIDLTAWASDADGDALQSVIITQPERGTLVQQPDGRWLYTPVPGFLGPDSFTYRVNDGQADSNIATIRLTVLPENHPPFARGLWVVLDEDTELRINLPDCATDMDGDSLSLHIIDGPTHGTLTANADGSYTYTPDPDFFGSDSFTWYANDGRADSNIGTVSITVRPVNDAPIAVDLSGELDEDSNLLIDLLAEASDVEGDVLNARIIDGPTHGTLTVNADGSFTYTPEPDYFGNDHFTYRVNDGQDDSNIATVSLTVHPINDAPTATGSLITGQEDTALILNWRDFAVHDIDDDDSELTITITALPADGRLELRDARGVWQAVTIGTQLVQAQLDAGLLRFVPAANASGGPGYTQSGYGNRLAHYARLAYTVSDGKLTSAETVLDIDITPVADAPTLQWEHPAVALREIFRTDWDKLPTGQSTNATILDGWTLLKADDSPKGGNNKDFSLINRNGDTWLELKVAGNSGHQTVGIERTVNTEAGATYTLSFDLAGSPATAADYLFVYVDGVRLEVSARTSLGKAQDGQTVSYQYTGTGQPQSIRIVYEPTPDHLNGHSVMLDDIVLAKAVPPNPDGWVSLPSIHAALNDTDGSETLTLTLAGLPTGCILTDGDHSITVTDTNPLNLTGWNTAALMLQPPSSFNGPLSLEIRATATESATGEEATVARALNVDVIATTLASNPALNPYVTLTTSMGSAETLTMPAEIIVGPLTPQPGGAGQFSVAAQPTKEENTADDSWMQKLEQTAKDQWVKLMGK
ncbi:MAG: tandem-95 repeat protein, partial [Azonexus sp.]|uniref:tandem-95 repeat protein n=1 Tax=Azonexus sp. TaxID=1872668 RepID=UPI002831D442